jgi:DNA mismatch endonuclease Vsr
MDVHTKEQRSKNMRSIKNKGTLIENLLAKEMWSRGLRYRRNDKNVFGKPDFSFKKYKIAVFCDSEFFHGKNWDNNKNHVKSNTKFWKDKIESNILRDKIVNEKLENEGWLVIRFWGEEIKNNYKECVTKIENLIKRVQ